jgi:secreted trypsin-like serine protease
MNKYFLNKIQYRIINGKSVHKNRYPHFASICLKGNNIPFCGGSYIGRNIVITAAHCLDEGLKSTDIVVQFKKNNIYNKGIQYNLKSFLIHPEYNPETLDNDIAVIFLMGNPTRKGIKKLHLPKIHQNWFYKINRKCVILGYGYTKNNGKQSFKLQHALIKIMDKNGDLNFYEKKSITNNMFLAADFKNMDDPTDNKDACTGDSGGPLFTWINKKKYLIGIVSWGYGCGLDLYPGVYTKVNNYRRWIKQNTGV